MTLEHHTPDRTYPLAAITVTEEPAAPSLRREFETLRSDPELTAEREGLAPYLEAAPDKTLAFVAEMDLDAPDVGGRRWSTPARCTPRSSARSPAAARTAA